MEKYNNIFLKGGQKAHKKRVLRHSFSYVLLYFFLFFVSFPTFYVFISFHTSVLLFFYILFTLFVRFCNRFLATLPLFYSKQLKSPDTPPYCHT